MTHPDIPDPIVDKILATRAAGPDLDTFDIARIVSDDLGKDIHQSTVTRVLDRERDRARNAMAMSRRRA